MPSDKVQYPSGFGYADLVAYGATGLVVLDAATQTVIKTPFCERNREAVERERQVYERLGKHASILSYHGVFEDGIRLEYASNHDLHSFTQQQRHVDPSLRLRWMTQVADALVHIHSRGIIHGDLTTRNVFIDAKLNARLADFAGSSIDSSPLLVAVTASHEYPGETLSARADIFAFGSMMYEVETGERPYSELDEDEIQSKFRMGVFPNVQSLGDVGVVIQTCWQGGYKDGRDLQRSIQAIQKGPERAYGAYSPRLLLCATAAVLCGLVYVKLARARSTLT